MQKTPGLMATTYAAPRVMANCRTQADVVVQRLMQHGRSRDGLAATLIASDGKHVPGPLRTQARSFMVVHLETVHAISTDLQSREWNYSVQQII